MPLPNESAETSCVSHMFLFHLEALRRIIESQFIFIAKSL